MDVELFQQRVAENVRRARHRAGMTLEEAAEGGRGAYRYLWELEAGRRNPSLEKLARLAELYGVTVSDLTDVVGARHRGLNLAELAVEAPKRGRKPAKKAGTPAQKKKVAEGKKRAAPARATKKPRSPAKK